MSFSAPQAPDPTATSNTQQQYNVAAGAAQNKGNSYNQDAPTGSMQYVVDPSSPSGYRLVSSLSAPQQGLLDTRTATQGATGRAGLDLAKSSAGMYSTPFDLDSASGAVAGRLNDWNARYLSPIFHQQDSNLEAKLREQGLTPGSEAYNNAKNLQARNQGDVTTDYLTKNQGQAFGQVLQQYKTPLETMAGLFNMSGPTAPTFQSTPTATIQPPNYTDAVQSNYKAQLGNYENTWNNVGKLGTAAAGLALAPMTGGLSLAGSIPGMFNSATNGMFQSNPYQNMPQIGGGWG